MRVVFLGVEQEADIDKRNITQRLRSVLLARLTLSVELREENTNWL